MTNGVDFKWSAVRVEPIAARPSVRYSAGMAPTGATKLEISLALQLLRQGDRAGAERRLKAAMKAQPRESAVLSVLGALLAGDKRYREAEPVLRAAASSPAASDAVCFHYGLTLQHLDRPREALEAFGKALARNPNNADAWFGRGSVLLEAGKAEEALAQFDRVLALNRDHYLAHQNKGAALLALNRYAESVASQDACLRINPNFAPAHFAKAQALDNLRQFAPALVSVEAGLLLAPDHAIGWRSRASICLQLGRLDAAIDSLRKALSLQPGNAEWNETLVEYKLTACEWSDYAADLAAARARIETGRSVSPALSVTLPLSAAEQRKAAVARLGPQESRRLAAPGRSEHRAPRPIRLAYLSNELRKHATAQLLIGALERHDRNRFQITVFNDEPRDGSPLQDRVIAAVDVLIDVLQAHDERIVELDHGETNRHSRLPRFSQ